MVAVLRAITLGRCSQYGAVTSRGSPPRAELKCDAVNRRFVGELGVPTSVGRPNKEAGRQPTKS
jgi:hypothetical protein